MPSSVRSSAKSGYRSRYSSNLVSRGMLGTPLQRDFGLSRARLADAIDPRRSAVDHLGLLPHLHRVRHHQQRVQELEQPLGVFGQVVERKPLAVGDRLFGTGKEGIVER